MSDIKAGDMVRVKDRSDWPSPPGYPMANSEGKVISVRDEEGFITLRISKTTPEILNDIGMTFRLDDVEKL